MYVDDAEELSKNILYGLPQKLKKFEIPVFDKKKHTENRNIHLAFRKKVIASLTTGIQKGELVYRMSRFFFIYNI
jgi:hypothetical protein